MILCNGKNGTKLDSSNYSLLSCLPIKILKNQLADLSRNSMKNKF